MRNKTKHVLKRALAVLMSMAVIFAAIPCYPAYAETAPVETTPNVLITSGSITAGGSTTLYVKASDFESVAGLEMAVHYDADAFDVSYAWTTGLSSGQVNDLNYATDGTVKYSMISVDGVSGSGYLLGITFDTTSETKAGDYQITLTVSDAYDVSFNSLPIGKTPGNITVKEKTQTTENIYFYSQLDKSSVKTSESFTYSLMAGNMSDLSGGNFEFTYDAEALEVVDVSLAETLTSKTAVQSINTKTPGYIKVSYAAIEAIGASYWDKLIDITFKAKDKAYDSTSIVFSTTELIGEDLAPMSASKLTDNIKITKPETAVDHPDFILLWNEVLNEDRTIDVVAKLPADTQVAAGDFVITYDADKLKCISAKADSAVSANGGYLVTKEDIGNGKVKFSYVTTEPSDKETALLNMTFEAVDQYIGEAVLSVKGTGVVDIDFKDVILDYPDKKVNIYKLDISSKTVTGLEESYVYTAAAIKPEITIEGLRADIDYTVTYKNNTNVGDAEVIIEGKGNYSGKIEKSFKIVAAEITGVTAEGYEGIYDGKAHSITLNGVPDGATVTYAETEDGEYTSNPIRLQNVGTKTVYYKVSKENYKELYGSADIDIAAAPIDEMEVRGIEESYIFTGHNIEPKATIEGLISGTDYEVSYVDNLNAGNAKVVVKGIGNYTGTIEKTFIIDPASIENMDIEDLKASYVYTGSEIRPKAGLDGLVEGTDFEAEYRDNIDVGTAKVILTGKGNYTGEVETTFEIINADMQGICAEDYNGSYDGKAHTITMVGVPEGAAVTFSDSMNGTYEDKELSLTNVGSKTVYYKVEKKNYNTVYGFAEITITPYDLSDMQVTGIEESYVYTGSKLTPEPVIEGLTAGTDYTVSYIDNLNVGTAKVTIVGKGNFKGSIEKTFEITPADIKGIEVAGFDGAYDGKEHSIAINGVPESAIVTYAIDEDGEYTEDAPAIKDIGELEVFYKISLANHNDLLGKAVVKITAANIEDLEVLGLKESYVYSGSLITPKVSIEGLTENTDYEVAYADNLNVGTAKVAITGKGNYEGTIEKSFEITPADITGVEAAGYEGIYDGENHTIILSNVPEGADVTYATDEEGEYTAEAPAIKNVGKLEVFYKVVLENHNDLLGEAVVKIDPASIENLEVTGIEERYIYSGSEFIPEVSIAGLVLGTDYEVTYADNLNVGTALVTITGIGNYGGKVIKHFDIIPAELQGVVIKSYVGTYDGNTHSITVESEDEISVVYATSKDGEYAAEKPSLVDVGALTVFYRITKDNYVDIEGSAKITITPASIENLEVTGIEESYIYSGSNINPEVSIEDLAAGTDYEVSYADNLNVGTAKVTITGKGNYEGTIEKTFEITPADIIGVKAAGYDGAYDGENHTITLSNVPEGAAVAYATEKDGEYTTEAPAIKNVGQLEVFYKITLDNHKDLIGSEVVNIIPASIEDLEVTGVEESYSCTGNAIKPEINIKGLSSGVDYLVTYSDNTAAGIAKVTIEGKGNYTGSKEINFEIKHSFSNDWTNDSESHWHECICGSIDSESPHEFTWEVDEPATEDATGLKHEVCSVCEYTQSWNTVIDKLPHTHDMIKVDAYEPDCEKQGNIEHYKCNKCGKYYSDNDGIDELSWADIVLDITDHTYSSEWHSNGVNHWYECKCGERTEITAHTFEWIEDRQPTEEAVGLKHEECTVCKHVRNENTEIDKLPHTHDIILVEAEDATCTEDGNIKCYYCNKCHKYYYDEEAQLEIPENGQVLPKGHELSYQAKAEADCTNPGNIEHYSCARCDAKFLDKDGTKQIPAGDEVIAALGHNMIAKYDKEGHWDQCTRCDIKENYAKHTLTWIIDNEATEDAVGSKHQECTGCEYELEPVEIDRLPHTHKMINIDAKEPTCSEEGNILYYSCDKCKKLYSDAEGNIEITLAETVIETLEHSYDVTKIEKASPTKNGSRHLKCKVCSHTDKEDIYKVGAIVLSDPILVYNGKKKTPSVTVNDSQGNVIDKTNYSVSYPSKRTKIGKYKLTVTFKGEYSGKNTAEFVIAPKAPTSASATLYGYDDIKFSWKKSTGVSGYAVYYKKATSSKYTRLTRTTKLSVKKGNLSDGVQYKFKVVPYYKSGKTYYESTAFKEVSIYTLKKLNTPVVTKSGSKVKVSWNNIDGETGYQISKATKSGKTSIVATYKTTKGTYKTLTAKKGTKYYYKVRAYKQVGKTKIYGPWSKVKAYKR